MEHYFGVAKEKGLTNAEIGVVQSIVMAVSACRVREQFREARTRSRQKSKKQSSRKNKKQSSRKSKK
jgi:hypothetical protein